MSAVTYVQQALYSYMWRSHISYPTVNYYCSISHCMQTSTCECATEKGKPANLYWWTWAEEHPSGLEPVNTSVHGLSPQGRAFHHLKNALAKNRKTWLFSFESSHESSQHSWIIFLYYVSFLQATKWKTAGDWHSMRIQIHLKTYSYKYEIQTGPSTAMLPLTCLSHKDCFWIHD